jgi:hypothetical protein
MLLIYSIKGEKAHLHYIDTDGNNRLNLLALTSNNDLQAGDEITCNIFFYL